MEDRGRYVVLKSEVKLTKELLHFTFRILNL